MRQALILFNECWRLSADNLQWIVQRYRAPKWRSVSFVASNKAVLRRVLREKGVDITPAAKVALERLPETFREWKSQQAQKPPRKPAEKNGLQECKRHVRASGRK